MGNLASVKSKRFADSPHKMRASQWPLLPYKGLNFYTAKDAALFCERNEEIEDCSQLLGSFATKMLLVHGRTGTGKSSFLRAGLFPRLMANPHFHIVRCANSDEPALIRSTGDPITSIMDWLHDRLSDPEAFVEVPPQAKLNTRRTLECPPGTAARVRAEMLLTALRSLTSRLSGTLVLAVDQAEEVFTLGSNETIEVRKAYFDLLDNLCHDRFDIKVILALRTEYYGQFSDSFRIGPDLSVSTVHSGLEQFMLHGIDASKRLESVILRPTLEVSPLPRLSAPYSRYKFRFEEGLVPTIVNDILCHCGESSTLPIVQLVCLDLYTDLLARKETVIRCSAYRELHGVQGAIDRYFEKAICEAMGRREKGKAKHLDAWRDVLSLLVAMQEGGALTSLLLPQSYLVEEAASFNAPEPIEATLVAMATAELRLLRTVDLRDPETGEHAVHYSLGHDALAIPLHEWKKGQKDRLKIKAARNRSWAIAAAMAVFVGMTGLAGYAAYSSAKKAAVEAILQGVETEPNVGSRILLLAAIEKNANFFDRKLLPMTRIETALRTTLTRAPFFSADAACAGFNPSGEWLALAGSDDSTESISLHALADRKAPPAKRMPPNPDLPKQQPCATGFVDNLTSPVLYSNDKLIYTTRDGTQQTPLNSLVTPQSGQRPRAADFGAGLFRLTAWQPNPTRGYTQTFHDFSFDADQSRFQPRFKSAPTSIIPSRNSAVFSGTSQLFAYTDTTDDRSQNHQSRSSATGAAKSSRPDNVVPDDNRTRVVVRSRDTPDTDEFAVKEARADYADPDQQLPWSISFLPSDDGSLVYRNKTGRFVFVTRGKNAAEPATSVYQIASDLTGLRPVPPQFSWGRPLLAAVAIEDQYRVAWITKDGIRVFESGPSRRLTPLRNNAALLPTLSDADPFSKIRFSSDGNELLFVKHQFNGVIVYAWDLRNERQKQISEADPDRLLADACAIAANIGSPMLQENDLKRLPGSLRSQPCSD
ncbi:hypothetical protein BN2475_420072 [Paraburkholderia ribeironis]|uniref:Novel STAND NTPase 1 domain-containing protein n=1 Tax=Paraburkholderia ribeironis TaxID=1247936 RepID=A0A1N7S7T7_9BURK|nr:ATP-binding protein [Paraburkholderia ribeironis]SIT43362.1 hypothetical protein BN2475_420072 [Paraburkholderia ribeironis]